MIIGDRLAIVVEHGDATLIADTCIAEVDGGGH